MRARERRACVSGRAGVFNSFLIATARLTHCCAALLPPHPSPELEKNRTAGEGRLHWTKWLGSGSKAFRPVVVGLRGHVDYSLSALANRLDGRDAPKSAETLNVRMCGVGGGDDPRSRHSRARPLESAISVP